MEVLSTLCFEEKSEVKEPRLECEGEALKYVEDEHLHEGRWY